MDMEEMQSMGGGGFSKQIAEMHSAVDAVAKSINETGDLNAGIDVLVVQLNSMKQGKDLGGLGIDQSKVIPQGAEV